MTVEIKKIKKLKELKRKLRSVSFKDWQLRNINFYDVKRNKPFYMNASIIKTATLCFTNSIKTE